MCFDKVKQGMFNGAQNSGMRACCRLRAQAYLCFRAWLCHDIWTQISSSSNNTVMRIQGPSESGDLAYHLCVVESRAMQEMNIRQIRRMTQIESKAYEDKSYLSSTS